MGENLAVTTKFAAREFRNADPALEHQTSQNLHQSKKCCPILHHHGSKPRDKMVLNARNGGQ